MRLELRVADRFDRGLLRQERHDLARVLDVALHPQRERLDALQDVERRGRGHARAEVAQPLAPRAQQERGDRRFLREVHAVEPRVGFGERRKFAGGVPVEPPRIDEQPADDDAVPAQELRRGMEEEVRPEVERAHQVRRRERRVDEERELCSVRDLGDRGHVEHVEARVAEGFAEDEARARPDGRAPGVEVAWVDERRLDAEAGQGVGEEIVRAAVERVARDDVRARAEQRAHREVHRRLAARRRDRADAALERGDALLQDRVGRVRDARVDVPAALHVEERRGVVGVLEDVGSGLVDRRRARAELRVGSLSGVQAQRVEAQVLRCRHGAVSSGQGRPILPPRPGRAVPPAA